MQTYFGCAVHDETMLVRGLESLVEGIQSGPSPARWEEGVPLSHAPILGVGGSAGRALAWAVSQSHYQRLALWNQNRPAEEHVIRPPLGDGMGFVLRQNQPAVGSWIMNCTGWTYNPPRRLSRIAATRLSRQAGYEPDVCQEAIYLAFSAAHQAWQSAVKRHYQLPPPSLTEDQCGQLLVRAAAAARQQRLRNLAYMPDEGDFMISQISWVHGARANCWSCHLWSGSYDHRKSWVTTCVTPRHPMCKGCVERFLMMGMES